MEMQARACRSVTEDSLMEMTHKKLLPSFSQIEGELSESEIYQQAIAEFQSLTGETLETAKTLINSVAKETMRVAFHLAFEQDANLSPEAANVPIQPIEAVQEKPHQSRKRLSMSRFVHGQESQNQDLASARVERCRQIGSAIAAERAAKGLSLEQMYTRTLVPTYHIQALEAGNVDELPEDVYLRSFIRQLGNALGLNGIALAASLPEAKMSVVPSWYRDSGSRKPVQITSTHLYLGYTALLAGTIGGLSWMSHQSAINASIEPDRPAPMNPSSKATHLEAETSSEQAVANVVPPETMNN
jgi:cytoskeleton protein RodZ